MQSQPCEHNWRLLAMTFVCIVSIMAHATLYWNAPYMTSSAAATIAAEHHMVHVCMSPCQPCICTHNTNISSDDNSTSAVTSSAMAAVPVNRTIASSGNSSMMNNSSAAMAVTVNRTYDYVGVIVETRATPSLIATVNHFMNVLGHDWLVQVWYAPENEAFLRNNAFINASVASQRIALMPLGPDYQAMGRTWYSCLLSQNISFWDAVGGKHVLIFQLDTCLCTNSPLTIYNFTQYDYIGAPWASWVKRRDGRGGNGGLSLRSSRAMRMCAIEQSLHPLLECPNEDGLIVDCLVRHLNDTNITPSWRIPLSRDESMIFAVETVYYRTPFGLHKPWPYISKQQQAQLESYCPEFTRVLRAH